MGISKQSFPEKLYYFCFYRQYFRNGHVNHHHVIIQTEDSDLLTVLDESDYQYRLISLHPVVLTTEDLDGLIIRGLVMDGESLLKRFKAQQNKKSIQTKQQNESR